MHQTLTYRALSIAHRRWILEGNASYSDRWRRIWNRWNGWRSAATHGTPLADNAGEVVPD